MATARIICVGNRLVPGDDLGPQVHDLLSASALPPEVELIDGGLRGLDLLPFVEGARRIIFVDALRGVAPPGSVTTLSGEEALAAQPARWDHASGLAYLLGILPRVVAGTPPECFVVGGDGSDAALVRAVAQRSLQCARGERWAT